MNPTKTDVKHYCQYTGTGITLLLLLLLFGNSATAESKEQVAPLRNAVDKSTHDKPRQTRHLSDHKRGAHINKRDHGQHREGHRRNDHNNYKRDKRNRHYGQSHGQHSYHDRYRGFKRHQIKKRVRHANHYNYRNRYYNHHREHRLHNMPKHAKRLRHRDFPLYYLAGSFYRPHSGGYISIRAPLGTRLKHLPAGFVTLTFGTAIYYLANNVYYKKEHDNYIVVDAPYTANNNVSQTDIASVYSEGNWAVYPNREQSPEQLENDRYQCHLWARGQTGYDPTQHTPLQPQRAPYFRAQAACLEGRGYTVR